MRRIHDSAGKAHVFHKIQPALATDLGESAGRKKMGIRSVKMVIGRIGRTAGIRPAAIFLRHARSDRRMILYNVTVAIDDFGFVLCHGSVPLCRGTACRAPTIYLLQLLTPRSVEKQ